MNNSIICGDSKDIIKEIDEDTVDLIYLDPPFYTQELQKLRAKDRDIEYTFEDRWKDIKDYLTFMEIRLKECYRVLKESGSIFLHCDRNAVHYLKVLMDEIFGYENFQSEIIWYYRRWSNSKKGLLNNHQSILFYSKSEKFKFHKMYKGYSETTNVDQILQERIRDKSGKSKYKLDENGEAVIGTEKKGVPLSDVWEIPYLNPKAKERVGYPTQKPVILLEQIIKLVTDENDLVLDPFAGSGTTLVAAKLLKRNYIGIDQSADAVRIAQERINHIVKTDSYLLKKGRKAYQNLSEDQMQILKMINAVPVQRNAGIDGFLSEYVNDKPVAVKIQRQNETLEEAAEKLEKAARRKKCEFKVLFRTHIDEEGDFMDSDNRIIMIDVYDLYLKQEIDRRKSQEGTYKFEVV